QPHGLAEGWRPRARRCIRWTPSGISPRCPVCTSLDGVAFTLALSQLKTSRWSSLERTPLDQGIRPTAQCRYMDVDPVLPPVDAARIVAEVRPLFGSQRIGEFLHILGHEVVLIQEDKWLEQDR